MLERRGYCGNGGIDNVLEQLDVDFKWEVLILLEMLGCLQSIVFGSENIWSSHSGPTFFERQARGSTYFS